MGGINNNTNIVLEREIATGAFMWLPNVGGTAGAITTDAPEGFTGYQDGATYVFKVLSVLGTAPATLNIGGFGAKAIYTGAGALCHFNVSSVQMVTYSAALDRFIAQASTTYGSPIKLGGSTSTGSAPAFSLFNHQHGSAIVGVTNGSDAVAGDVGEYTETVLVAGSEIALVSSAPTQIIAHPLSAGDWDITGYGVIVPSGAIDILAATVAINPVTLVRGDDAYRRQTPGANPDGLIGPQAVTLSPIRVSLAAAGFVYLNALVTWVAGPTVGIRGGIKARRAR